LSKFKLFNRLSKDRMSINSLV